MTTALTWIAITALTVLVYLVMALALSLVDLIACPIYHGFMRRWGAELQCPLCGEDVHLANSQRPIQFELRKNQ